MKTLTTVALWLAALALAAWILMRFRRRDRIVLRGRFSPRLVRMVAILIVAFGWRPSEAEAVPPPEQCTTLPPVTLPVPPPPFVAPPRAALTVTEDDLSRFPNGTLAKRALDAFTKARISTTAADRKSAPGLLADAERLARLAEASTQTIAEVGIPVFRPWMGKAGAPPGQGYERNIEEFLAVMRKKLPDATAGTWETEAVLDLVAVTDGELVRENVTTKIPAGQSVRFRRFDLLRAGEKPLRLRHATLGELVVEPGRTIASWDVPTFLDDKARTLVADLVQKTTWCDAAAAAQLELILPAAQQALRDALAAPPEPNPRPGRPMLSLLVALYDE